MEDFPSLRVVVIGLSGSGKTTFATHLAEAAGIDQIELDLINWRAGWYDRYRNEHEAFVQDVMDATAVENWVLAGGYSKVRRMIMSRATTVVWLDLPKGLVLRQVFWRSFVRAFDRKPILNGNTESFVKWLNKDHPIQLVWRNHKRKTRQFAEELDAPESQHLEVFRCRSRAEVEATLQELSARRTRQV